MTWCAGLNGSLVPHIEPKDKMNNKYFTGPEVWCGAVVLENIGQIYCFFGRRRKVRTKVPRKHVWQIYHIFKKRPKQREHVFRFWDDTLILAPQFICTGQSRNTTWAPRGSDWKRLCSQKLLMLVTATWQSRVCINFTGSCRASSFTSEF